MLLCIYACSSTSDLIFYHVATDKESQGSIIKTVAVDDPLECIGQCLYTSHCRSFNVHKLATGQHNCILLSQHRCGIPLNDKVGFSFFDSKMFCKFNLKLVNGKQLCIGINQGYLVIQTNCSLIFTLGNDGVTLMVDDKIVCPENFDKLLDINEALTDIMLKTHCRNSKWKFVGTDGSFMIEHTSSSDKRKCIHVKGGSSKIDTENTRITLFQGSGPDSHGCWPKDKTLFKMVHL